MEILLLRTSANLNLSMLTETMANDPTFCPKLEEISDRDYHHTVPRCCPLTVTASDGFR